MRYPSEAISILLQANPPLLYRAIKFNIRLFYWNDALEIATKSSRNELIELVLCYKKQFLDRVGCKESNTKFKEYFQKYPETLKNERVRQLKEKLRNEIE